MRGRLPYHYLVFRKLSRECSIDTTSRRELVAERRQNTLEIIPAIDIRRGECVRLYQGDFTQETVFHNDPVALALKWQSMGAPRVHIIDLDGAAIGKPCNLEIITEIANTLIIPIQVGGGIRHLETIEQLLEAGVDRVILGTSAVEAPILIREACRSFSESIVVCADTRRGKIAIHAWQQDTEIRAIELAKSMVELGVKRFIHTDISCDGTLTKPNFTSIAKIIYAVRLPIIAAGGTSSLAQLRLLSQLGVEGAIVGKALYTGDINLKQALATVSSPPIKASPIHIESPH